MPLTLGPMTTTNHNKTRRRIGAALLPLAGLLGIAGLTSSSLADEDYDAIEAEILRDAGLRSDLLEDADDASSTGPALAFVLPVVACAGGGAALLVSSRRRPA